MKGAETASENKSFISIISFLRTHLPTEKDRIPIWRQPELIENVIIK